MNTIGVVVGQLTEKAVVTVVENAIEKLEPLNLKMKGQIMLVAGAVFLVTGACLLYANKNMQGIEHYFDA